MTIYHEHHVIKFVKGKRIRTDITKRITVKQHAKEHKTLYEVGGHKADLLAWKALSGQIGKEQILHERALLGASQPGKLNGMYGKNHSKKSRAQMSKKRKGVKLSASHVANITEARKKQTNLGIHKHVGPCPRCGRTGMNGGALYHHLNAKQKCKSL